MIRRNGQRATILYSTVAALGAPAAGAQQVLEIDTTTGRVIIDDEWRAIRTMEDMPLDRTRAILYVTDDEEQEEGVMAFSLETGEWIRTIPTPEGDGPRELSRGISGMSLGRDGRLYVAGYVRVLEFDPLGRYVDNWRPQVETVWGACEFGGQPTVVGYGGVVRRGPDGANERFGPGIVDHRTTTTEKTPDGRVTYASGSPPRIACTEDAAYVVARSGEGADSVFVHHRNGEMERWAVPDELAEALDDDCNVPVNQSGTSLPCTAWPRYRKPSLDSRGNLVLIGHDIEVPGAIIDPETGCYAVVRKPGRSFDYGALHMYRDSALVFRNVAWGDDQGRFTLSSTANRVSLHPLRRVSGEPCPGMLPVR
ncbi:MAG: hypothetical protein J4F34_06910 [Gemmatimonadetes bacterium]|nr:hypothetical protein [Gemmatimonadota bacterium]